MLRLGRYFISGAFAAYPMTEDRIKRAQQAISTLLPAKYEYIVDTNEFQEVKSRLADTVHERAPSEKGPSGTSPTYARG